MKIIRWWIELRGYSDRELLVGEFEMPDDVLQDEVAEEIKNDVFSKIEICWEEVKEVK